MLCALPMSHTGAVGIQFSAFGSSSRAGILADISRSICSAVGFYFVIHEGRAIYVHVSNLYSETQLYIYLQNV